MAPHDKDQFDDLLDAALKRYGDVQPRPGLEGRVLARLAQESRTNWRRPWTWASATTAFACLLAIVVWIGVVGRTKPPHPAGNAAKVITKENRLETAEVPRQIDKTRRTRKHEAKKRLQLANTTPRLEQFPSPRPLSEQEKLLLVYASEYPKQAAEVAQEQDRRDKELQAMYPVPAPDSNQER